MKLKIFLLWLVAIALSPILLQIPEVGSVIVLVTVVGPVLLFFGFILVDAMEKGYTPTGYTEYDIDKARDEGYQQGRRHGPY
ncbi:hypothetical protein [Acidithiobacillus sp.]|jgi:hypothetical protein|uniref:hypothetical protein n=1 Tax=Acidithiobacillus sp. TaxID=1872118 RepID=UPI003D038BEA